MSKKVSTFEQLMDFPVLSKTRAKELHSLKHKKNRDQTGLFLAEGNKCVSDMMGAFPLKWLICNKEWLEDHKKEAEKFKDKVLISDTKGLETVSSLSTPTNVIAVFEKPKETENKIILDKENFYVLLDDVQDPGNVGTIIRTCDWFGVYEIFATKDTADVFSPKVVQASMGSLSRVRVKTVDPVDLINKNPEIEVIGAMLNGKPLKSIDSGTKGMLIVGNEGKGVSEELQALINLPVTIPSVNEKYHPDSLNVGIATAIILSYFR